MKNLLYTLLSLLIILNSCTIEKRVHLPGYNVEWKNNWSAKNNLKQNNTTEPEVESEANAKINEKNVAVNTNSIILDNSTASNDNIYIEIPKEERLISTVSNHNRTSDAPNEITNQEDKTQSIMQVHKAKNKVKQLSKKLNSSNSSDDVPVGLLYLLAILIPFVAVGIVTDWDVKTVVINLLWCLLCGIPGIIHACIIVSRNS